MAATSLVEQSVYFISPNNTYDEEGIQANSLIQSLAANSQGGTLLVSYESDWVWNSTTSTWTYGTLLRLRSYVQPAFVSTILANMPNLQTAFPQYTVVTFGTNVSFGY